MLAAARAEHRTLFDFSTGEVAGVGGGREWTTVTDAPWGGKSKASFSTEGVAAFTGFTSLEKPTDVGVGRTGFCAARSEPWPDQEVIDCDDYASIELVVRSDGRVYAVNLDVDSFFTGELYQGFINLPASPEWRTIVLPFEQFMLTRGGRATVRQRYLDRCHVRSIGFSISDGREGPFRFECKSIRAVDPKF